MIPSIIYGRPLSIWLLYSKLPILFGIRLYIINLNEVDVRPRNFQTVPPKLRGFSTAKGGPF